MGVGGRGVVNTSKGRNFAAVGILKHKKHMEVTCHLTLPLQSSCTTIQLLYPAENLILSILKC